MSINLLKSTDTGSHSREHTFDGRYTVVKRLLARNANMIFLCKDTLCVEKLVVLKMIATERIKDKSIIQRFEKEIQLSLSIDHPNVVKAQGCFIDNDAIGLVLEYIEGHNLAQMLSKESPLKIEQCVSILLQICSGLSVIHAQNVIHRDLKLENILVTEDETVKIADFGIARTDMDERLTQVGAIIGSFENFSPEYIQYGQLDTRSDIYALGVVAYQIVTGTSAFTEKRFVEGMIERVQSDPKPPHELREDCPVSLENIILKAMARDPNLRYQQIGDMEAELALLQSSLSSEKVDNTKVTSQRHIAPKSKAVIRPLRLVRKQKAPENKSIESTANNSHIATPITIKHTLIHTHKKDADPTVVDDRDLTPSLHERVSQSLINALSTTRNVWRKHCPRRIYLIFSLCLLLPILTAAALYSFDKEFHSKITSYVDIVTTETNSLTSTTKKFLYSFNKEFHSKITDYVDIITTKTNSLTSTAKKLLSVKHKIQPIHKILANTQKNNQSTIDKRKGKQGLPNAYLVHKVRHRGETLSLISKWYTGNPRNWTVIAKANNKRNPQVISIGESIRIPQSLVIQEKVLSIK